MASQTFGSRLRHAWNAFLNRDPPGKSYYGGYSYRPDRVRLNRGNDRTILTAILSRIAMDAAAIAINHVRLDENGRYSETVDSGLNVCLNLSANKDQTGRALRYDMFLSVLDEGVIALVPVDVDVDDRLYQSSHFYLKQEWVDMEGLTNVGYIYDSYHELGGNGTGTALYNKIKELPIRDS